MNEPAPPDVAALESLVSGLTDEFMARLDRGEAPDAEEYARRYPQIADVLRQVLPALQALRASGPQPKGDPTAAAPPPHCLGDYRVLREAGRGGMGVVYEAEQISLGRRVALKVLPFAATMDPRQLQRFRNEARAAACLDHPHIVKVHAVGHERGVHDVAMQFLDGRTLADLIEEQRRGRGVGCPPPAVVPPTVGFAMPPAPPAPGDPSAPTDVRAAATTERAPRDAASFGRAAEWGVQAAEALEHAHALGIVHRDVKPANLMVDGHGHLWVTDFGLARTGVDSGLTMTGDLLGTLRYMSPEQALARHGLVDHRTDVYSLGATLYELLTLEPGFAGNDRQELLRQIAFEEPRPPRKLNRAIPEELETVVLKATAKNPAERYATARELADDLKRFLEDRPIRAKRPALVQRARP